jgi:transposase
MQVVPPHPPNTVDLPVVYENSATPFANETVELTKQAYIKLTWEANYWKVQHGRACKREDALKKKLAQSQAKIRDLQQRLYGKKSEKGKKDGPETQRRSLRKRGQQKGSKGHGRTPRPHLPVVEEELDIDQKQCPICEKPFDEFKGTEDSEVIEIQVKGYIRRIKRKRYKKTCQCEKTPGIITAPVVPRLIAKSPLGISVWTEILLNKFLYAQPLNRLCTDFGYLGLPVSQGTITGGLKRLLRLFEPLVQAMLEKQMTERLFHGDETRWMVFESVEGKTGYRWYLWITQSDSVIYYRVAPSRGTDVAMEHFSGLPEDIDKVILVCDRYSAYKRLAKLCPVILLAFCWAHVRRDFIDAARRWPELEAWMFAWIENIGELYRLNAKRLEHWDETRAESKQSPAFIERHQALVQKLTGMAKRRDFYLGQDTIHSAQKAVLKSLKNHWFGLSVFVEHPKVPMDNNKAERSIRNPVTGRRNYYGSGSIWSAGLAAMQFTLLQTILHWGLNPRHWLHSFLSACADNGGNPPEDLSPFLPWQMEQACQVELSRPLPPDEHWIQPGMPDMPEIRDTS